MEVQVEQTHPLPKNLLKPHRKRLPLLSPVMGSPLDVNAREVMNRGLAFFYIGRFSCEVI